MSARTLRFVWILTAVGALSATVLPVFAASQEFLEQEGSRLWSTVRADSVLTPGDGSGRPGPERFLSLRLEVEELRLMLEDAPKEDQVRLRDSTRRIVLPMPDASWQEFTFVEAAVMAPELAARYPQIRTYVGRAVDPAASVRFDLTPQGFHAQVLSPAGAFYIDPLRPGDTAHYASYYERDHRGEPGGFECLTGSDRDPEPAPAALSSRRSPETLESGETLRTYRMACAATGEYTAFHGGTVVSGLAAVVTAINRVSGILENDLAIRLQLVANNDNVIYTNSATDPYSNNDVVAMLTENQINLDAVIGAGNYDIGHVLTTGPGGIARLQGPCTNVKARANSGTSSPTGDSYHVNIVAHEIGHQFGATHSWNGVDGACTGSNRTASTAYEPGSGSTIMSYAGICSSDNVQGNSDPYYHVASLDQMIQWSQVLAGNNCPAKTSTGNTPPLVDAGPDFIIPSQTPFLLTASGSDINGDTVTYSWEEFDLGPPAPLTFPDNGSIPLFRSLPPPTDPSRSLPQLSSVLANNSFDSEKLPVLSRTMTWRVTARDNNPAGGGIETDSMQVVVEGSAGPFQVTAPLGGATWLTDGTVTWDVAGTNLAPVSAPLVDITLSTDGGQNFDTVLASNTPNDGSEFIDVTGIQTTSARIRVQASDNIFYDVNPGNFIIAVPDVSYAASTVDDSRGNGNGWVDPDEWVQLVVELQNDGLGVAAGTTALLTTTTPGVNVIDNLASWGNISGETSRLSLPPHFAFAVEGTVPCGTVIDFDLDITSNDGSFADSFQVTVGGPTVTCDPVSCFAVAVVDAIPDGVCDGESSTLDASTSGSYGNGCSGNLEYRFESGGTPIQDWSSDPDLLVTPMVSTLYTIVVRDVGAAVQDQLNKVVVVSPAPSAPTVVQNPDPVCVEVNALELDAGPGFATYTWRDDGAQVVGAGQILALDASACGRVYSVEVGNAEGCTDVAQLQVSCDVCTPAEVSPAGSTVPFRVDIDGAGTLEFELVPGSNVIYHLYVAETLAEVVAGDWSYKFCDLESNPFGVWTPVNATTTRWTPLAAGLLPAGNWVVVAEDLGYESPYGFQSFGTPRPPDVDATGSLGNFGCP